MPRPPDLPKLRMEDAKRRLERRTDSLERIALEVGHEDPTFFTRLFRRAPNLRNIS